MTSSGTTIFAAWILIFFVLPFPNYFLNNAEASGSGLMTICSPLLSPNAELHPRRVIRLAQIGSMVAGESAEGMIRMVTFDHPGLRPGNLIIKETTAKDGSKMIHLSVPDAFPDKLVRATLFVAGTSEKEFLEERVGIEWVLHKPSMLRVSRPDGTTTELYAYRVATYGPYRLLPESLVEEYLVPSDKKAAWIHGLAGDGSLGFGTVGLSVILFFVARGFSRRRHAAEQRPEGR
jgi:hypothetical protein